jgi:hypothetical protein
MILATRGISAWALSIDPKTLEQVLFLPDGSVVPFSDSAESVYS